MLTIIGVLAGVLAGFILGRYSNKPIKEIAPVKALYTHINVVKEAKAEKELTPEERAEQRKANTFYN